MAREVFEMRYSYLPPWNVLESHFDEMTKHTLAENNNSAPSKSNAVTEENDLPSSNSFSTPPRNGPVLLGRNSSPTEDDSPGEGNIRNISENYLTPAKVTSTLNKNGPMVSEGSLGIIGHSDPPSPSLVPLFYSTYIHDLESIWWIIIWVLIEYRRAGFDESTEDYESEIAQRKKYITELFSLRRDLTERSDLLVEGWKLMGLMEIVQDSFKGLVQVASIFREKLASTYKEEEWKVDFPIKLKDGGLLHQDILEAFRTSAIEYFDVDHINDKYTIMSEKKPGSSKRSINEDSEEERPSKRARQEFLYS